MNLLVTGGAGFIGSNFVHHWNREHPGDLIVNLDALTYAGSRLNLENLSEPGRHLFVEGNIGDEALVRGLLHDHRIDAVVNFAAESHVDRSIDGPLPFVETNVTGTVRLLENARRYWKDTSAKDFRFLHISTDEVFGTLGPADPAFRETNRHLPNSPYAASKAAADHFVRAYFHTYGLPVLTSNCSNNYGPRQFPEKLIPLMLLNALEERPLPIYGDGGQVRDWLHVTDHCRALELVLTRGRPGETYNIGGAAELTNLEVVDTLCALLDEIRPRPGGGHARLKQHVADRPGHDRRYAMDFSKLEKELGWKPQRTFQEGLRETIQWYLANLDWCAAVAGGGDHRERLGLAASKADIP